MNTISATERRTYWQLRKYNSLNYVADNIMTWCDGYMMIDKRQFSSEAINS